MLRCRQSIKIFDEAIEDWGVVSKDSSERGEGRKRTTDWSVRFGKKGRRSGW